ncbi:MAG TPA: ATP-binding protein [Kofleriaceae bacterium]
MTERVREDEALQMETKLSLRLLLESIKDYAIFMLDPEGRVASWNPGAERIKGYRAEEIVGRHFSTFYPDEDILAGKCDLELAVAAETGRFEDEAWRLRKDGTRFWANVIITAVRDEDGRLIGFGKVTRDLTERRQVERERAARLAAEQASRAKDEFIAILAHELRSPLAPIVTALQLARLRGKDIPELDVIERQTQNVVRLVEDLLDVPRITRGKIDLHVERIEMAEVVSQAIEMAAPVLEQRRHIVDLSVPRLGCAVMGDRFRLAQVVANLLTNAAKYSEPPGRIVLSAVAAGGRVRIRVRDHGLGIEPAMLSRIFDSFVQETGARERSMGGLGLGLTIVKSLVKLHHGTVIARSDGPGKGSEFEVELPSADATAEDEAHGQIAAVASSADDRTSDPTQGTATRRVLIVDDSEDAATLLAEVISALGHSPRVAHEGTAAIDVARQFRPDIALIDIELPVMDGYQLAGHLRREPWARGLHLVAVTGHAESDARQQSRAAGFHDHIAKPLDLATIQRILRAGAAE